MKSKPVEDSHLFDSYYDHEEDYNYDKPVFVLVEKIIALTDTRARVGSSWWSHLKGAGHMCTIRLGSLWKGLQRKGLTRFKSSFISPSYGCVYLNHYIDHDVYMVDIDGNHRTTWAKIVKAPYIRACVTSYRLNKDAYIHYERDRIEFKKQKKERGHQKGKLIAMLRELGLTHSGSNLYLQDNVVAKDFDLPNVRFRDSATCIKIDQEQISKYCEIITQVRSLIMFTKALNPLVRPLVLLFWRIKQTLLYDYVNLTSFKIFFKLKSSQTKEVQGEKRV